MKYLTVDNLIFIHDEVLKRYGGGAEGIYIPEGRGKLDSMLTRMKNGFFGHQPFETLLQKTAFQFQSILQYHPFVDGMKRTGIYSTISFLLMNDYYFESKSVEEDVKFAIYVADELTQKDPDIAIKEIVEWLKIRTFSIYDKERVIKFVHHNYNFTCPRCKGDNISIISPFCKDCSLQLVGHDIFFNGIIMSRKFRLERPTIYDIKLLFSPKTQFNWNLREIEITMKTRKDKELKIQLGKK